MNQIAIDYLLRGSEAQQDLFERLHNLIMALYPQAENDISYGLLKFYIGKKRVWLGYWKQGVSLYTGFPELITEFKSKHPELKTGKGCVNFRFTDKIPLSDVKKLIRAVML